MSAMHSRRKAGINHRFPCTVTISPWSSSARRTPQRVHRSRRCSLPHKPCEHPQLQVVRAAPPTPIKALGQSRAMLTSSPAVHALSMKTTTTKNHFQSLKCRWVERGYSKIKIKKTNTNTHHLSLDIALHLGFCSKLERENSLQIQKGIRFSFGFYCNSPRLPPK